MKVLIVRLGALGDIVHALPVAAAIRAEWPSARIDWLADARYVELLRYVPILDRRIAINTAGRRVAAGALSSSDRSFERRRDLPSALRALRAERYDVAIDLQGLIKSAVLARSAGAARTVGFSRRFLREPAARYFYSDTVDATGCAHVVDKNLAALSALGVSGRERRFPLEPPDSPARAVVRQTLAERRVTRFALLNPGAAWPNKRWPVERFAEVAAWLLREHGLVSVVPWGPGEEAVARAVVDGAGTAAFMAPPTRIGDLIAIARDASLALSGDTGPLHIAAACGVPTVALFGPTDPARNGPWEADDICLSRFDRCVCHYQRRCRRERACIEEISAEEVRGAIDRRLAIANHA